MDRKQGAGEPAPNPKPRSKLARKIEQAKMILATTGKAPDEPGPSSRADIIGNITLEQLREWRFEAKGIIKRSSFLEGLVRMLLKELEKHEDLGISGGAISMLKEVAEVYKLCEIVEKNVASAEDREAAFTAIDLVYVQPRLGGYVPLDA